MNNKSGQVRIIAGKWRRRKLQFPEINDLRPSHDRIRETVFNWLQPDIVGAVCLDLFAGSGAFGFEALSRGAEQVVMIDNSSEVIAALRDNANKLGAEGCEILSAQIPDGIPPLSHRTFNIVFIDPPYRQDLLQPTCQWLQNSGMLAASALVYVEAERDLEVLPIPSEWTVYREGHTKSLQYLLLRAL